MLVIQTGRARSGERAGDLVSGRLSFMRFLGLGNRVPDARTIWLFREKLTKAGAIQALFNRFDAMLRGAGYIVMAGQDRSSDHQNETPVDERPSRADKPDH